MQKISVAIISQGLFCCFQTGLLVLKERERLLAVTIRWSFDWSRPLVLVTMYVGETTYAVI